MFDRNDFSVWTILCLSVCPNTIVYFTGASYQSLCLTEMTSAFGPYSNNALERYELDCNDKEEYFKSLVQVVVNKYKDKQILITGSQWKTFQR